MSLQSDNNFISESHEITNINSPDKKEDFYQSYLNAYETGSNQEGQISSSPKHELIYAQHYFEKANNDNFISPSKRSKTALGKADPSQLPPPKTQP